MSRPRTPINTYGRLKVELIAPGRWRARTRYRFDDGTLRQVERWGDTRTKAELALRKALVTITASAAVEVRREMRLSVLADRFLQSKANLAPRSVDTYRQTIEHHIKPNIGELAISEATTERLQRFVTRVQLENGPGAAKACRAVLSGMMGLAARSDAIRGNPVRDLAPLSRRGKGATAVPLERLPELVAKVRADAQLQKLDLADVLEFLIGTGCRVGEVCAIRWDVVDLENGTVSIQANVVRARGRGVILQDHPKTAAGVRVIALPPSLVELLRRRRAEATDRGRGDDLVFPTVLGNLRDPRNTSRDWTLARDRLGFPGITTHSFRKSVATALDQAGLSARAIAEYLGHENPSITQDVYMAKNTGGKRAAKALGSVLGEPAKRRRSNPQTPLWT
jgi:integrase